MKLIILGSSSRGNGYLLISSTGEVLIIEAGVPLMEVKKALNFDLSKVMGLICSHRHGDHAGRLKEYLQAGIDAYASDDTFSSITAPSWRYRMKPMMAKIKYTIGAFTVLPFDAEHDVPCFGFMLFHPETGSCLFLTDSMYSKYTFAGLNNLIIEANYDEEILEEMAEHGANKFVANRVKWNHMSLQNCKELLQANDLKAVNNIVLCHLSNNNSNAGKFKSEIEAVTGRTVTVADAGMTIPFSKNTFLKKPTMPDIIVLSYGVLSETLDKQLDKLNMKYDKKKVATFQKERDCINQLRFNSNLLTESMVDKILHKLHKKIMAYVAKANGLSVKNIPMGGYL